MGFWKNVVTLGAQARIDSAIRKYEEHRVEVTALATAYDEASASLKIDFERLRATKVRALRSLKRLKRLVANVSLRDRQLETFGLSGAAVGELHQVQATIDAGEQARNAARGLASGAGTAMGAWALVGSVGAASTGTAISTLSGAAAKSATLAWFGGGSLAAGGGGVATGTLVLGGIVVLPALGVSAILSHRSAGKKVQEIAEQRQILVRAETELRAALALAEACRQRVREIEVALNAVHHAFQIEFGKSSRRLYPLGFISRLLAWFRGLSDPTSLSHDQIRDLHSLVTIGAELAKHVDMKVFESGSSR